MKTRPTGTNGGARDDVLESSNQVNCSTSSPVPQIEAELDRCLAPLGPEELAKLRALWWRWARLGHRLPAERGVILLDGERR